MNVSEKVSVPNGYLVIKSYDINGKLVDQVEGYNIITNDGREALAHLMGNDSTLDWYVDEIQLSDGGHNPVDVTEMLPVNVTDTDLFHAAVFTKAITDANISFPSTRKVTFSSSMETTEGNGTGTQAYSEAGLFYRSGTFMFTHKTFGYVIKNNTTRLVITWTFTF